MCAPDFYRVIVSQGATRVNCHASVEMDRKKILLKGLGHAILGNFSTDQMVNKLKYENNGSRL